MEKPGKAEIDKVINDWNKHFPALKRYGSGRKLLKLYGPLIYGIELEAFLSDVYRPRVVLFTLLDDRTAFAFAIDQLIKDKKGLDLDVTYKLHDVQFIDAVNTLIKQSIIPLEENINPEHAIKYIFKFLNIRPMGSNPFASCHTIMLLSKYIDNQDMADNYFNVAVKLIKEESSDHFIKSNFENFDLWVEQQKKLTLTDLNERVKANIIKAKLNRW